MEHLHACWQFVNQLVMAGCYRQGSICITFDCPLQHYQACINDNKPNNEPYRNETKIILDKV